MTDLLGRFYSSSSSGGGGGLDPIALVKRAIPDDMPLKVTEILPRLKDGGAFVKVQYDASTSPSEIECQSVCLFFFPHVFLGGVGVGCVAPSRLTLVSSSSNASAEAREASAETVV